MPTRGIKHWGLSGYSSILPRIKFDVTGQEFSPQSPTISYRQPLYAIRMKRNRLLILILLIQNSLIGQDIANEYFEEVTSIESVDNYELYIEKCDSVLTLKPDDFNARFSKALIFSYKNQYELERQEYRSILLLDSTNSDIYYNLAATYINQHENLIYISEEIDYERERSERKNHWECMGDQKECMDIAELIYPLIKRAALVDTSTVIEYPNLKEMEYTLRDFINEKE